ncbi:hypothetical protein G6L37_04125 [Agrobacterium rubi]|nr:hypothetical protein [Agrobacterium rubi]NTF24538.1 hypothetical protein [Agrobacterium rubi]
MPSIIITALSVVILAFALVAGTNFVNPSLQSRTEVSRVLGAQYAAISSAIASYKVENQGVRPTSLDDVRGYVAAGAIDGFGHRSKSFAWSIREIDGGRSSLCLSYVAGTETDYGSFMGLQRFVVDIEEQRPGRVSLSRTCTAAAIDLPLGKVADHLSAQNADLAIRFEDR